MTQTVTVGVLALQGAFREHIKLLETAIAFGEDSEISWNVLEVRTPAELLRCDALIIPGGESTTMSLVAARSDLLEPLRDFVKVYRKPTWGTCAGLILLSESANRTKQGGQDLIGGLDVRVSRNYFGRQTESFEADLDLPFLALANRPDDKSNKPYRGIFIRAPVVEKVLPLTMGEHLSEAAQEDMVIAPSRAPGDAMAEKMFARPVEVMATLPGRTTRAIQKRSQTSRNGEAQDIIAVRQGNVFGTSFHPELTRDARIHMWWLQEVRNFIKSKRTLELRS